MPPPPIPAHMKRFTANAAKPVARYRPGKALQKEDSDEGFETEEEEERPQIQPKRKPQSKPQARPAQRQPQPVSVEAEDDDGFVTDEEEQPKIDINAITQSETRAAIRPLIEGHAPHSSSESSEEEFDSGDDSSASSSEDEPQRKFLRPTFIKKTDRETTLAPSNHDRAATTPLPTTSSLADQDTSTRRLEQATLLIKDTIERDTLARLAGKKAWDDDDENIPLEAQVDDTDDLDPEAEYLAWRLRELTRLKRDRDTLIAREKELEEIERRRNLTASERDEEDRKFIENQKADVESGRGQLAELGRYHHKGAFFLDDETSARLAKRDLAGARFEDDVDKSVLPEYMKMRDLTKLGKKGGTRYTDLKGQDTGRFGDDVKRWRGSGFSQERKREDVKGVADARFLPDLHGAGPDRSGANASVLGTRRVRSRSRSPRNGRSENACRAIDENDPRKPELRRSQTRSRSPIESRSRSRSALRRYRDAKRKSPSPFLERDKRKRIKT